MSEKQSNTTFDKLNKLEPASAREVLLEMLQKHPDMEQIILEMLECQNDPNWTNFMPLPPERGFPSLPILPLPILSKNFMRDSKH